MAQVSIVERGGQRDTLGEGLLWSGRENAVYWTDILAPALNRLDLATGAVARWAMPERLGWVIERRDVAGSFIAGFQSGLAELSLDPVAVVPFLDPEPDLPANRLNDAKADGEGRIWFGTMPVSCEGETGAFYLLDGDRALTKVDGPYTIANGPALSPDRRTLYHTDTGPGVIYRFDRRDDGTLGQRRPFITFEADWGFPDGMTCDAEGGLWVAHWGGACISRFDAAGRRERWIDLPASQITNIAFAGERCDRMFVTSAADGRPEEQAAGCLFEVESGVTGLPPGQFAG